MMGGMPPPRHLVALLTLLTTSCVQTFSSYPQAMAAEGRRGFVQGFVGVAELSTLGLGLGAGDSLRDDDDATLPSFGGVLGEFYTDPTRPLRLGLEGGFSYFWDRGRQLEVSGPGLPPEPRRTDVEFTDAFFGLSADLDLGRRFRLYGGAGPVLQYGEIEVRSETGGEDYLDNGFGLGWYARAGLEFSIYPGGWIGLGARWLDSRVDLGAGGEDASIEALQLLFTASGRW